MKNYKTVRSNFLLMLTALIWGAAFVAQSVGMEYVGPFTFNSVRSFIGGLVLIPVIFLFRNEKAEREYKKNDLIAGGILCGIVLAVASSLQQIGISMGTSSGKAGFITALYMIMVPFFGIFIGRKVTLKAWIAVVFGILGMYLLCITEDFNICMGDIIIFFGAVCFAVHILVIDIYSPKVNGVKMSCIQFFVSGIVNAVPMLLFEHPQTTTVIAAWQPILYAGVMSCGVAYTLQIVAQKNTSPVAASLILSLESVFAVLAGWAVLGDVLTSKEVLGCVLVFFGIILSQLPLESVLKKKEHTL